MAKPTFDGVNADDIKVWFDDETGNVTVTPDTPMQSSDYLDADGNSIIGGGGGDGEGGDSAGSGSGGGLDSAQVVLLTGDQQISGIKTFNDPVGVGTTDPLHLMHLNETPTAGFGSPMLQVGGVSFTSGGQYGIGLGYTATSYSNPPTEIAAVSTSSSGGTTADLVFGTRNVTTDTAPTERMRITSDGEVGIGTNVPSELLNIVGTAGDAKIRFDGDTSNLQNNYIGVLGYDNLTIAADEANTGTASRIQFRVDADEKMRVTHEGKVGIGLTEPDAKLHVAGDMTIDTYLTLRTTDDQANKWFMYTHTDDTFRLNYNGAGADEVVVDTSGNVGIGTSSPNQLLTLGSTTGSATIGLDFETSNTVRGSILYNAGAGEMAFTSGYSGYGGYMTFDCNGAERMRINTSGEMQIGGTTNAGFLDFDGTSLQLNTQRNPNTGTFVNSGASHAGITLRGASGGSQIRFYTAQANNTAASERMRIDAAGRVGINSNSPVAPLCVKGVNTGDTELDINGGTADVTLECINRSNLNATLTFGYYSRNGSHRWYTGAYSERMRLENGGDLHVDGDVVAFSATISDIRLKENVEVVESAVEKVQQLRGVTYDRHDGVRSAGVIAQDVEEVLPEAVVEKELAFVDGGKYKTVQYDALHALLIEAIKELKAEIDELKSK